MPKGSKKGWAHVVSRQNNYKIRGEESGSDGLTEKQNILQRLMNPKFGNFNRSERLEKFC
jgi:hypothetical protein